MPTEICPLTVLEARIQNQGFGRAVFPLKSLRVNPSLLLTASGGSKHSLACGSIPPVPASVFFTWPFPLFLSWEGAQQTATPARANFPIVIRAPLTVHGTAILPKLN